MEATAIAGKRATRASTGSGQDEVGWRAGTNKPAIRALPRRHRPRLADHFLEREELSVADVEPEHLGERSARRSFDKSRPGPNVDWQTAPPPSSPKRPPMNMLR
jgi:hypothetical protein